MWTVAVSGRKKLRIRKYPDTCGRGLNVTGLNKSIINDAPFSGGCIIKATILHLYKKPIVLKIAPKRGKLNGVAESFSVTARLAAKVS